MNGRWAFICVALSFVVVSQLLASSIAKAQDDTVASPSGDLAIYKNDSIAGTGGVGPVTFVPQFALVRTVGGISGDVDSVDAAVFDYGAFFGFPPNQWQVWSATLSPPGAGWPPSGVDLLPIPGMPGMFVASPRKDYRCQFRPVGTVRPNANQTGMIHVMDQKRP